MVQSIDSILVPTDGSDGAMAAARRAIDLADRAGAALHVVSVVEVPAGESGQPDETDRADRGELLDADADRAIESVAITAQEHLSESVVTAVESGTPFRRITEYADEHDVDMIVMGTHGRTGLERFLLGSVAEKTLRTSPVPVCTVSPAAGEIEIGATSYDTVLLPTDGSEGAERAMDWGIAIADLYDGTVHTVYSVDTSRFTSTGSVASLHEQLERTGRRALESVRDRAVAADVNVVANLGTGPAARMILDYADEHDVDLIAMGTHGRSGAERYLVGSVTETVVRHADVPVCSVPMTPEE